MSNKFQRAVIKETKRREEEEFNAMEKEVGGTFEDFVDVVETEIPGENYVRIDFVDKDPEGYKKWSEGIDKLRDFKEIKKEVKKELKKGPKL